MKKTLSLVLSLILAVSALAGCGPKEEAVTNNEAQYSINFGDYKDSEDIPSWEGKKINVSVWNDANSTEAFVRYKRSKDDVVTPEYERVTGVTYDYENSFDNGGNSFDAKITQIVAAGNYPAMAYSLPELSDLVKTDRLYELSSYIEKYCPNIMKYFGPETVYGSIWAEQKENYGGLYAIPTGENAVTIRDMTNIDKSYDLTQEQLDRICGAPTTPHGYFWVREDVLKMLYPESHTIAELQEILEKNGKFTEEEIFDIPLETPQDFMDLFYKVDALEIPDDGLGKVHTTFTHYGKDNWMATSVALPLFGYAGDCMDYYDIEEKKLKFTFREPWFKDILKFYNGLVNDGVASSEALLDTFQGFTEKYNNGRYLISLYRTAPNGNETNQYKYRRVWVKYTNSYDKILTNGTLPDSLRKISFFKEGISEEDLIQVLRAVDFSLSAPGQKLILWGPKSAGLYTEDENGKLQYTDEDLKNQMIDSGAYGDELIQKYGLGAGPWPGRPRTNCSMYSPKAYYDATLTVSNAFNAGYVDPMDFPAHGVSDFYSTEYTAVVEGAKTFWQARNAFEEALTQVFAAKDEEQFEERYNAMIELSERNGLTEETLKQYQAEFEKRNKIYEGNIEAFLEKYKNRDK